MLFVLLASAVSNTKAVSLRGHQARTSNATVDTTAGDMPFDFPAMPTSNLLSGFDAAKGQTAASAFEAVGPCSNVSSPTDACIEDAVPPGGMSSYEKKIFSEEENSQLTNTIVSAEGGGWGFHMSASMKFLQQSQMNTRSLSYTIGKSTQTKVSAIRNPQNLKLTDAAKALLQTDPKNFLQQFGPHYTKAMTYGGSFLGSYTMNSIKTSSTHDLDVAASVSYSNGFFSAEGSAAFQKQRNSTNFNLDLEAKFRASPDVNFKRDPAESPEAMFSIFQDWENKLDETPAPLTVSLGPWKDSSEVFGIVFSNSTSKEVQQLFSGEPISAIIGDLVAEDVAKATLLQKSIGRAILWPELNDKPQLMQRVTDLKLKVNQHLIDASTELTEARLLELQVEYQKGNLSWFTAAGFEQEFDAAIAQIPTPAPTPTPTPPAPTPTPEDCSCKHCVENILIHGHKCQTLRPCVEDSGCKYKNDPCIAAIIDSGAGCQSLCKCEGLRYPGHDAKKCRDPYTCPRPGHLL
jgi:hypothetical protein